MKVLKMFKKWILNVLDSLVKTFKSTDNLMKFAFVIPCLLIVATTPIHTVVASRCTETGSTGMPFYLATVFLFLSMLFSIVVAYVGLGYGGKRKVSSFIVLMIFVVIYLLCTVLFLVISRTDAGILKILNGEDLAKIKETNLNFTKCIILQVIAIVSCVAGSVLAALKIDPTYYKERNN